MPDDTESGDLLDFTYKLTEDRREPGRPLWELRIKICNRTDEPQRGAVAENPWGVNGEKIFRDHDANGDGIPDSDQVLSKELAQEVSLAPKGQPGDCKELVFRFDVKPREAYTDFYRFKEDG